MLFPCHTGVVRTSEIANVTVSYLCPYLNPCLWPWWLFWGWNMKQIVMAVFVFKENWHLREWYMLFRKIIVVHLYLLCFCCDWLYFKKHLLWSLTVLLTVLLEVGWERVLLFVHHIWYKRITVRGSFFPKRFVPLFSIV